MNNTQVSQLAPLLKQLKQNSLYREIQQIHGFTIVITKGQELDTPQLVISIRNEAMKFRYQKTIHLNTDISSAWNAITHPHFERDFLPEIRRSRSLATGLAESISCELLRWRPTDDSTIALTRTDLNVAISAIEISLTPLCSGVSVSIRVDYKKRFENNFIKAHLAVRGLFDKKLRVLKEDLAPLVHECAFQ